MQWSERTIPIGRRISRVHRTSHRHRGPSAAARTLPALVALGMAWLPIGPSAARPAQAAAVTWSFPDSIAACPAGDSVVTGRPARLRVEIAYTWLPGGIPTPRAGAPPDSIWVEWPAGGPDATANDQPQRAFADDSTDALGRARVTIPSLSGCGTFPFTVWVSGEQVGAGSALVRSVDANGDGAVDAADAPCDLDFDGDVDGDDFARRAEHFRHSHRNALFGTLVRRTNLCESCQEFSPGTMGESSLAWSPDGRFLAFTIHMPPTGECAVFLAPTDPADGDELVQFTFPDSGVHDYDPTWSPLGTEIAFGRNDNTILVKGIPGLAADTSLRLVTQHLDGSYQERGDVTPSFSPDGEWIAFGRKTFPTTHWELWKTPANGDTTRRVRLVVETNGDDFYPQWSTDGQWIAYDRLAPGGHSAWKVPAAGGAPVPLLLPGSGIRASTPSFAPDGAVILAGVGPSFPGAATHTLDAALGGVTLPTDSAVVAHAGFVVPGGFPVLSPRMSPDGTRLALRTRQLYAARRNMSRPPRVVAVAGLAVNPATPFVDLNAHAGLPLSFAVLADDPEGDVVSLVAHFLRDGMSFGGGLFSWTPHDSFAGRTVVVRFQATTPSGGSAYALARIAVGDATGVGPAWVPGEFGLSSARPNPSSGSARVTLGLPRDEAVAADVFDLAGRRVRELLRGRLPAGSHVITWDGLDAGGRAAPAGLYLVRVRAGQRTAESRLVRLADAR